MTWIIGIVGFTVIIAPFTLKYSENILALWTSIIVGGILLLIAINNMVRKNTQTRYRQL